MRSLRWKILLVSLLLVFIPVYFLNRYAIRFFDLFTRTQLESHLKTYAFLLGEEYKQTLAEGPEARRAAFEQFLKRAATEVGARIRV
ncbi:MAG: hypothetical protein N2255_01065, partial [Kiritimatiellae bacterium]|nr:hypothetical protein [Kiritimatiellia bacterium]